MYMHEYNTKALMYRNPFDDGGGIGINLYKVAMVYTWFNLYCIFVEREPVLHYHICIYSYIIHAVTV